MLPSEEIIVISAILNYRGLSSFCREKHPSTFAHNHTAELHSVSEGLKAIKPWMTLGGIVFDEVFMIVRVVQTEDGNSIDVTRIVKYYNDAV